MTPADRFRAAREAFELAMRLGCTPCEAARELRKRRLACGRRAEATEAAPIGADDAGETPAPASNFQAWNNPWMMRE